MQDKRTRRSAKQWQALIDQQAQSGQTVQTFCDERGLTTSSFQAWKAKLRKGDTGFHKIKMNSGSPAPTINCRLPSGIRLEWQESVSPNSMITIILGLS